jgi:lysozyme
MLEGPDVSSHQGQVNWSAVAGAGIGFGFTKASGGACYRNPTFGANWSGMRQAGLPRGAYHYAFESSLQPFPGPGPEAEAAYFLSTVLPHGLGQGDMLALDIEEGPSDLNLGQWALAWCRYVERQVGYKPLVYTAAFFTDPHHFAEVPELAEYGLWLADWQELEPAPVAPWSSITFWQHTDRAQVAGIAGPVDLNRLLGPEPIAQYGSPYESVVPAPDPNLPVYDSGYPAVAQNDNWSCSCTSVRWGLLAWGRGTTEQWIESTMLQDGIVTTQLGLMDASGGELAAWLNQQFGGPEYGYLASHDGLVSFDEVAHEAGEQKHPLFIGGRTWGHWSGVRGYDGLKLILANPAPGWMGVTQSLSREQFNYLGDFSLVRLGHPAAEAGGVAPPPDPGPTPPPYEGAIGSGLLEMMAADHTTPAQRGSTWLPLGVTPSDVESCYGANGTLYTWLLTVGKGFRYPPA